ncbi:hypothetical protein J2Z40_000895 [Cytobacillus eiseniae]|uniref:Uncharacterized protein n=1 Tax=Cytobacillus eiseniae TaxID=762947 RepID=A0ABS4RBR6_9BACI|nr:hypothetical protein [Cytobacillus eiseniae]
MQWNWTTVFVVQVFVWLIVLFERKHLSNSPKADKITFAALLFIASFMSFFNLEILPGPLTLLDYIFGPFERMME